MDAHELARKLLEMPNETVFIHTESEKGSFNIKDVKLCECGAEIFIYMEDH